MGISLTYKTFKTALMLFGFSDPNVYGSMMDDSVDAVKALFAAGYLTEGPMTMMVPDREGDDPSDWVEAKWNPETRTYQYSGFTVCGEWVVDVPDEDVKTYDINMDWMANHIRDLVGIETTGKARAIIPDLLWELGRVQAGQQRATIFLAKNLVHPHIFERVYDAFLDWAGKSPGIVLTNKDLEKRHADLPGGHRILGLKNLIVETANGYEMDMELLHGTLKGASPFVAALPVSPSSDYSSLRVHGREFVFTGDKQRKIIEKLYYAWKVGNPKRRTQSVLVAVDSKATSLSHLFSNHSDWKDVIGYGGGFCWLKV